MGGDVQRCERGRGVGRVVERRGDRSACRDRARPGAQPLPGDGRLLPQGRLCNHLLAPAPPLARDRTAQRRTVRAGAVLAASAEGGAERARPGRRLGRQGTEPPAALLHRQAGRGLSRGRHPADGRARAQERGGGAGARGAGVHWAADDAGWAQVRPAPLRAPHRRAGVGGGRRPHAPFPLPGGPRAVCRRGVPGAVGRQRAQRAHAPDQLLAQPAGRGLQALRRRRRRRRLQAHRHLGV